MGLSEWLFGGPKSPKNEDAKASAAKEEAVTRTAAPVEIEYHTTKKKLILYAYLAFLGLIWHDIFSHIFGIIGQILITFVIAYSAILCYPGSIGRWDVKDRLQIRSIIIIKMSVVTGLIGLPLWALVVADQRWLSFLPIGLFRTLFLLYVGWFLGFDKKAGKTGVRYVESLRQRKFWKHLAGYFPISLTRTAKLDPEKNYIFGYHPHGIISVGALCNFGTYATGFDELFPGIDLRLLTLSVNFKFPLYREYFLAMGINDASKESIEYHMSKKGRSVLLVVGGAAESLETNVSENNLILQDRKGFVKMALKTGANLVPIFSFGENDIFETVKFEGKWKRLQMWLQKKMGFALPLFFGRALTGGLEHILFKCNAGIFPFRTPIHSFVGAPVEIPKKFTEEEITPELLDKYHDMYIKALKELHDNNKGEFTQEKEKRLSQVSSTDQERKSIMEDKKFAKLKEEPKDLKIK